MGHAPTTAEPRAHDSYEALTARLNVMPQGAPPSPLLYRLLALLMSEREAGLVAKLPIRPVTAASAARAWGLREPEARRVLDDLADRAILLDMEGPDGTIWILPPPMAGFFEFSMMRVRDDLDERLLAELFYEYITVEDDFITALFTEGTTQLGRTFVHEPALEAARAHAPNRRDGDLHVLDHERSSEVIETAEHIGIGLCYCRRKMDLLDRACEAPQAICMTFGGTADSLIRHGFARRVDRAEGRDLLEEAYGNGLVQFGENVQRGVNFICNCCGCCCEAMIAQRRFGAFHPVHTTNFLPHVDAEACNGCGKCVNACPVEAMVLVSANDPAHPRRRAAQLEADRCLGCGVCTRSCTRDALWLVPRPARVITPVDTLHRSVLMAIERGKLADLVFEEQGHLRHRVMAGILGAILRLPPTAQLLATRQFRSRYLVRILERLQV
ncbi:MAG TPA: 4Fe-4S dicluster domain-containing protein [Candidatus Limnocylindrales bacterium]|nr:4Fe-4S dicluster domain-containing protein [Candidatus Limnocylindrales bacterium]